MHACMAHGSIYGTIYIYYYRYIWTSSGQASIKGVYIPAAFITTAQQSANSRQEYGT